MVWFQCEDCGENLKKPKLPHHFCICPATKLSCIDCGEMFGQQSAQGHNQCITEAEKYGPKGQAKPPYGAQLKPNKPKPNTDVDVNVGLSSCHPWRCSLCNTTTTSRLTLQSHADGKKHRAKARAYHARQKQSSPAQESAANLSNEDQVRDEEAKDGNTTEIPKAEDAHKEAQVVVAEQTFDGTTPKSSKKRKSESSNVEGTKKGDFSNGEVIQADKEVLKCSKKKKQSSETNPSDDACPDQDEQNQGLGKIKWKQLVTSILRSNPDGCLKVKKLKKLFLKAVAESGAANKAMENDLLEKLMMKVSKTSRFVVEGKVVRFASDTGAASA